MSDTPQLTYGELDREAEDVSALARERADETERERRLPDELVSSLRASIRFASASFTVSSGSGPASSSPAVALRARRSIIVTG